MCEFEIKVLTILSLFVAFGNLLLIHELVRIVKHFLALQSYAYYAQMQVAQQQQQEQQAQQEQPSGEVVVLGFGGKHET